MCFRTDHLRALSCTVTLVCLTQPAYQIFVLGREGVNVSPDCGAEKAKGASESFHRSCGDSKLHVSPSFQSASSTENWGYLQGLNKQSTQPSATTGFLNTPNTQVNQLHLFMWRPWVNNLHPHPTLTPFPHVCVFKTAFLSFESEYRPKNQRRFRRKTEREHNRITKAKKQGR